jgi:hypothetical protein
MFGSAFLLRKLAIRNKLARLELFPVVVLDPEFETKVLSRKAKSFPKNGLSAGTDRATRVEPISATSIVRRLL